MKLLATAAAGVLIATQSLAGTYEVRCETTSVPYQTQENASTEKVVGGAVIGGVLGKVVTNKDGGALAGAVIGGAIANENGKKTVTRYREVETCNNVFIPERITNAVVLEQNLLDLNAGADVSKETTMDVQYTIGVSHDGKWGPKSREAADIYLASLDGVVTPAESDEPLYSLVVNDVVIVSSTDITAIDEIKSALFEAGVDSAIFVDLE